MMKDKNQTYLKFKMVKKNRVFDQTILSANLLIIILSNSNPLRKQGYVHPA